MAHAPRRSASAREAQAPWGDWQELGLLTGASEVIDGHDRLLRSLSWNDPDYAGNALSVLRTMVEDDPRTLPIIEQYLDRKFPGDGQYISAKPAERKITFAPHVFQVPNGNVELDLVAVMMPFDKAFDPTHSAIKKACSARALRCQRVDDIWEDSTIIQDIFALIFRAQVVVVDFTGKNPNVMYETGIAHMLGKHVIPITQSLDDVPFDMRHHRTLKYLPNHEGVTALEQALAKKLEQFGVVLPKARRSAPEVPEGLAAHISPAGRYVKPACFGKIAFVLPMARAPPRLHGQSDVSGPDESHWLDQLLLRGRRARLGGQQGAVRAGECHHA